MCNMQTVLFCYYLLGCSTNGSGFTGEHNCEMKALLVGAGFNFLATLEFYKRLFVAGVPHLTSETTNFLVERNNLN